MKDIKNLSLDEKIGQRFIFGTNTDNIEILLKLVKDNYIGGVILYRKNYETYDDMLSLIKKLKEANSNNKIPLFIAIDQEAGKVDRTPSEIHRLKNIYDTSRTDPKLIIDHARVVGDILSGTGINMNFSPVMDIYNNSKSQAVYKRCFYGDENDVYNCGMTYANELKNKGIIPVIKHFPGHGSSTLDSHFIIPYVWNYKKVLSKHMIPFKKAITNGIDCIMVGHISIRKLTSSIPASISTSFLNKYLREEYNFKGLIISDEINMLIRTGIYSLIYKKKALKSSCDMLLVKVKTYEEALSFINKYKEIYDKTDLNSIVKRVLCIKEKYKITDRINYKGLNLKKINNEIDRINKIVKSDEEYQ